MKTKILNKIEKMMNKEYYLFKRYNVESTYALVKHNGKVDKEELLGHLRESDELIKIDDNHCFIAFMFTNHENAFKAAQNLLHKTNGNQYNMYIAIETFNTHHSVHKVIAVLLEIIKELENQGGYHRIDDESILNF